MWITANQNAPCLFLCAQSFSLADETVVLYLKVKGWLSGRLHSGEGKGVYLRQVLSETNIFLHAFYAF